MITASTYPTTLPKVQRGSGHFAIIDPYKYCPELDAVIAVAKSKGYRLPTDYQLRCLNDYINEQKSNGIWQRKDLLYNFLYNSLYSRQLTLAGLEGTNFYPSIESFCRLNLINPLKYELDKVFYSPTDTINPYYSPIGAINPNNAYPGYYNTNFIPGVDGVNWSRNSASITSYFSNFRDQSAINFPCGSSNSTISCSSTFSPNNGGNTRGAINRTGTGANVLVSSVSSGVGFHHLDRSASNLTSYYKNGVFVTSNTFASATLDTTYPFFICARNVSGTGIRYFANPLGMISFNSSLGATLQKIDYEIFTQFRTKLGY